MNSSKWIWRSVGSVSIAATLLLLYGFLQQYKVSRLQSQWLALNLYIPVHRRHKLRHPLLIRRGVSGSCHWRFASQRHGDDSGSGFVRRSVSLLNNQEGHKAQLINNLGINGLTTQGLLTKLDEPGVSYVLKKANVIIVSIGGNDLFQGLRLPKLAKSHLHSVVCVKLCLMPPNVCKKC